MKKILKLLMILSELFINQAKAERLFFSNQHYMLFVQSGSGFPYISGNCNLGVKIQGTVDNFTVEVKYFSSGNPHYPDKCEADGKLYAQFKDCRWIDSLYTGGGKFMECYGYRSSYRWPAAITTEYWDEMNGHIQICDDFKKYPDSSRECGTFSLTPWTRK